MKPVEIILLVITAIAAVLFIIKGAIPAISGIINKNDTKKKQKKILTWMLATFAVIALALILYP